MHSFKSFYLDLFILGLFYVLMVSGWFQTNFSEGKKAEIKTFIGLTGSQSDSGLIQSLCLYSDLIGSSSESVRWPVRINFRMFCAKDDC